MECFGIRLFVALFDQDGGLLFRHSILRNVLLFTCWLSPVGQYDDLLLFSIFYVAECSFICLLVSSFGQDYVLLLIQIPYVAEYFAIRLFVILLGQGGDLLFRHFNWWNVLLFACLFVRVIVMTICCLFIHFMIVESFVIPV